MLHTLTCWWEFIDVVDDVSGATRRMSLCASSSHQSCSIWIRTLQIQTNPSGT